MVLVTPQIRSRVDVHLFASDLLRQRPPVVFDSYNTDDRGGLRLEDGNGVKVAISGDRSSLRMLLAGALHQLGPPTPDLEPPLGRHDESPTEP